MNQVIILLCFVGWPGVALATSEKNPELDSYLRDLFYDPQKQVSGDNSIYRNLKHVEHLIEEGHQTVYSMYAGYVDDAIFLVKHCRPEVKLPECSLEADLVRHKRIDGIRAPAMGNFLRNCKLRILDNCASKILDENLPILDRMNRVRLILRLNSGPEVDRYNPNKYGRRVAMIMVSMNRKRTVEAVNRIQGGKKAFEVEFDWLLWKPCQDFLEDFHDPRTESYGIEPFAFSKSSANSIVYWNTIAKHCKIISDNKKLVVNDSFESSKKEAKTPLETNLLPEHIKKWYNLRRKIKNG